MMNIHNHSFFTTYGVLSARILMGIFFLLSGIGKLQDIAGTAGYISSTGLPASLLLAWGAAIFETLLGLFIIIGYHLRQTALLLAVFTLFVSFLFHNPTMWDQTNPIQQIMFMKNLAIIAGLLMMVAHGPGNCWRVGKKQTSIEI